MNAFCNFGRARGIAIALLTIVSVVADPMTCGQNAENQQKACCVKHTCNPANNSQKDCCRTKPFGDRQYLAAAPKLAAKANLHSAAILNTSYTDSTRIGITREPAVVAEGACATPQAVRVVLFLPDLILTSALTECGRFCA